MTQEPGGAQRRRLRSDEVTKGINRAPHRALLRVPLSKYGIPFSALGNKPMIGIMGSYTDQVNGHIHLDQVMDAATQGVLDAGGIPFQANTIAMCDGTVMGRKAMAYSLPSRESIADDVETMAAHGWDGMVLVSSCDKIVPGMWLGAIRTDIPSVHVAGGPMIAGQYKGRSLTLVSGAFQGVGQCTAGKISEGELGEIEQRSCPGIGSCQGMYTANTLNSIGETLISLPGNGTILASKNGKFVNEDRLQLAYDSGRRAVEMVENGDEAFLPRNRFSDKALENAAMADMALGGSTNTIIHLLACARERERVTGLESKFVLSTFEKIAKKVPYICSLDPSPHAKGLCLQDLDRAGGVMAVLHSLDEITPGLLHGDELSVSGRPLRKHFGEARVLDDRVIRTSLEKAYLPRGGLMIMGGNLAPEGAVTKVGAIENLETCRYKARVFDDERTANNAIKNREILPGQVVIIRYEGPISGMREMLEATSMLTGQGLGEEVATFTDGRLSGGSNGKCICHVSPEAAVGGPIALIHEGDEIEINFEEQRVDLKVPEGEMRRRRADWRPVQKDIPHGRLKKFAVFAASASRGAGTDWNKVDEFLRAR